MVYKAAQPGEMISPVSAGGGLQNGHMHHCRYGLFRDRRDKESFINRVKAGQPVVANLNVTQMGYTCRSNSHSTTADRNKATVRVRIGLLEKDESTA